MMGLCNYFTIFLSSPFIKQTGFENPIQNSSEVGLISSLTKNSNYLRTRMQFYSWLTHTFWRNVANRISDYYCIMMALLWMKYSCAYTLEWKLEPTRWNSYKSPGTQTKWDSNNSLFLTCFLPSDLQVKLPQSEWHAASFAHSVSLCICSLNRTDKGKRKALEQCYQKRRIQSERDSINRWDRYLEGQGENLQHASLQSLQQHPRSDCHHCFPFQLGLWAPPGLICSPYLALQDWAQAGIVTTFMLVLPFLSSSSLWKQLALTESWHLVQTRTGVPGLSWNEVTRTHGQRLETPGRLLRGH